MSDRVRIQVEATDNASDDFQRIGQNAARMGQQVTQAGKTAGQGLKAVAVDGAQLNRVLDQIEANTRQTAAGIDKLGQSASKADASVKKSRDTFVAMGAAATTLAGFLSDAARAAAEEEAIFARLETAVDATGESYADYAVQIEQAIDASERLSFSDDKTAEALANLTATTGDAAEALELLGLAQDLARGKGIELAAAANIVGRVAEGNTGIPARYGIAIQEGATAQEALAAVQERYAGQAEAYAETTAGAYDRVKNTIDNFVESIGSGTGDLQLLLTLLPGISAGYTLVGGAAGLAVKGIQSLRAASALATVALGPVGLALAATSAVVAIGAMTDWFGLAADGASDYEEAVKSAQAATKLLDDTIYGLRSDSEAFLNAQEISAQLREVTTALGIYSDRYEEFVQFRDDHPGWTDEEIRQQWGILRGEDLLPMLDRLGATGDQIERVVEITNDLVSKFDDAGVNGVKLANDLDGLFDQFQNGEINAQQFISGLESMSSGFNENYVAIERATRALSLYTETQLKLAAANRAGLVNPMAELGDDSVAAVLDEQNTAISESTRLITEQGTALGDIKQDANAYAQALHAANEATAAFIGTAENILPTLLAAGKGLSGDQGFLRPILELQQAQGALDNAFRIIVGGTEALGQSSQQVADWASELSGITFEGGVFATEIGKVNDALASGELSWEDYEAAAAEAQSSLSKSLQNGKITSEEYAAAMTASTDILWNNARIQEDIASIQAQQAPFLADATAAYAAYVAELEAGTAAEQRRALALGDSATSARVAELYALAYAGAVGEIPEDVSTQLIVDAANADPILADVLSQLGLITKDETGAWVVTFDDSDAISMQDAVTDLSAAIADLTAAINELNGTTISPNIDQAAMDALLAIGKYNPATPTLGDGTGGPYGSAGGGGNVRSDPGPEPISGPAVKPVRIELDARTFYGELDAAQQALADTIDPEYVATLSADAEPYFRVSTDVQANAELLAGTEQELIVSADGEQAISVFRNVEGEIVAITDGSHIVKVEGDPSDATNDIALVNRALNDLNGTEGVIYVNGDPSDAVDAVAQAEAARQSVDGSTSTIYVGGDNAGALNAFNAVNGRVGYATIYIQGVPVGTALPGGGPAGAVFRDGGIVGYDAAALDGIVTHGGYRTIRVGEAGPEIMRVPPGSSVTPAPMTNALTGGSGGGKEVHLHFHNAVYGLDDFQQQVAQGVRSAMYQGQYQ
jgi:hypothetical protein